MSWQIEYVDEFEIWWASLGEEEQARMAASIDLLEVHGPNLGHPHSSGIRMSRHPHMRELRIQHAGRPYRILYAFDPRRAGILLLGGDKTGDSRWYERNVPIADSRYDELLLELKREKEI